MLVLSDCWFVFFFKQKTAYEMRISDWSSDVCSSDLKHLATGKTFATIAVGNDGDKAWPECRVQPPSDMVNAIAVGACDTTSDAWQREIGRASCRERVCQYV